MCLVKIIYNGKCCFFKKVIIVFTRQPASRRLIEYVCVFILIH